jgi:hypothetical protein
MKTLTFAVLLFIAPILYAAEVLDKGTYRVRSFELTLRAL